MISNGTVVLGLMFLAASVGLVLLFLKSLKSFQDPCCIHCGYLRHGSTGPKCPECGLSWGEMPPDRFSLWLGLTFCAFLFWLLLMLLLISSFDLFF